MFPRQTVQKPSRPGSVAMETIYWGQSGFRVLASLSTHTQVLIEKPYTHKYTL